MSASHPRARRGRPRRSVPKALPDDLYDYGDDPAQPHAARRRNLAPNAFDIGRLPVIDDWPECVPVTEAEVDIFERYFGDVFDRLFCPLDPNSGNEDLSKLTLDVNNKP
jgi:hypothetical protein